MNAQKEEDWLMQFLKGLNSNILKIMSPLPNVHQAYSVAIQDERRRQIALRFGYFFRRMQSYRYYGADAFVPSVISSYIARILKTYH
ncbi:hypothetical protein POTOM_042814 [Populus tomentosa]|uniref:Uncharacterized protein n=1 Tax=Populus tomentosa TaxID=118781 RepID=A0A8X7YL83_POPTO|nr:hypothetical protein POTOM_042814 [Populus tomentosa]